MTLSSPKRAIIVGYGNIGRFVLQAILESPDFELVAIVRRNPQMIPPELANYLVVDDLSKVGTVDIAFLCTPTREVPLWAEKALARGIHTVDSYDIHSGIVDLRQKLQAIALDHHAVAITAAGWDPGSDSVVRTWLKAMAPKGLTYTNFGPGMSMGHSVAAKAIEGVKNALSMTIPLGTGVHRRMVYVELESNASLADVTKNLKADDYFAHDETHVIPVNDINELQDMGHGVSMIRKGVSGITQNQIFEFQMRINNPALTAQIMVSAGRASFKQRPGCYTLIEIPPVDMLWGDREALIAELV